MIFELLLEPTTGADSGGLNPTIVASLIAAFAAMIAAMVSIVNRIGQAGNSVTLKRIEDDLSSRKRELDFRRRQLDDFYGQVHMLRRASQILRKELPDVDGSGNRWRLVDNITVIQEGSNEKHKAAAINILKIDHEIAALMKSSTSLFEEFDRPVFDKFVDHVFLLQLYWDQNVNQEAGKSEPFPDELDTILSGDIAAINFRLRELLKPAPPRLAFWKRILA